MIEVGAPTGKWQLIVVYRGKHCPVSRNYLASLQQIIYELDDLGVEVLALTADGREKAEAFVSFLLAAITHSPKHDSVAHRGCAYWCGAQSDCRSFTISAAQSVLQLCAAAVVHRKSSFDRTNTDLCVVSPVVHHIVA